MKDYLYVLREVEKLPEDKKVTYMKKHANAIFLNAMTFPSIPNNNTAVKNAANLLSDKLAAIDGTKAAQDAYEAQLVICYLIMLENYDYVDLIALGNSVIISKAGLNFSSSNTTRTAAPGKPTDAKYLLSATPNQLKFKIKADKLMYSGLAITTSDTSVVVVASGPSQIKISKDKTDIFIDFFTTNTVIIDHLVGGIATTTMIVLGNPNGISPITKLPLAIPPISE